MDATAFSPPDAGLSASCGQRVRFLHDRRVPGADSRIAHIAIAPTGVWVIDAGELRGQAVIERSSSEGPRLKIAGHDHTALIDGLDRRVKCVREAVSAYDPTIPVQGALWCMSTDLPLLGTLHMRGYPLLWRKRLVTRLGWPGPVCSGEGRQLEARLEATFRPA